MECWNNHRLSSEHFLTPYQLFLTGRLEEFRTESSQEHLHIQIHHYFRISDPVAVSRSSFQPCQVLITMLELYINQFIPGSVDFRVTCYNKCVSLVGSPYALFVHADHAKRLLPLVTSCKVILVKFGELKAFIFLCIIIITEG